MQLVITKLVYGMSVNVVPIALVLPSLPLLTNARKNYSILYQTGEIILIAVSN